MNNTIASRQAWADNLRVIATLSMVLLHVIAPLLYQFGKIGPGIWHSANILDSSLRFCVPVFVMLSGALLLKQDYGIRDFLKRRVMRVLLPFAFYSFVYIWYDLAYRHRGSRGDILVLVWNKLAHGAAYHLWYVYMIIGLYLFIPVIGRWVRASTSRELLYFLGIWVVTMAVAHPQFIKLKPDFNLSYFSGFLGYLILGYYLVRFRASSWWKPLYSVLLLIAGILITAVGTFLISSRSNYFDSLYYAYLTPNVLLSSTGVFMLAGNFSFGNKWVDRVRQWLCRYSFGIYLVHVLVLSELSKAGLNCFYMHPAVGVPLTTLACLVISGVLVFLLNKIPFGKYISG